MIATLTGGVGGSKLALGLYDRLGANLTAIGNTADDTVLHGLHVSPDLDTLMYTLAGISNQSAGWGLAGDSFGAMDMLGRYGREDWFRLGDRDLGTHLARTEMLAEGMSLTRVTRALAAALGVQATILPMCDEKVSTFVVTSGREIAFQEYFVRGRAAGKVAAIRFEGIEGARVTAEIASALALARAVILGPSNPMVSIGPILAVPGLRRSVAEAPGPKVAVSPIIGRSSVSGPAGRMMEAAGVEVSVHGVAELYADFLDGLVIDEADAGEAGRLRERGLRVLVTNTIMRTNEDKVRLASETLDFALDVEHHA